MSKDLQKKNTKDLEKELAEKRVALRDIRFGAAHSKSKNVKEYAKIKKEIAVINTALNAKNQ